MSQVEHNAAQHRYELTEEGLTATADYRRNGQTLMITYVQSPPPLRGKGTAGRLMAGMLDEVRDEGLKVTPICGYAAAWIRRHPDYQDLLA
jgi:predicted GNAT family acetyltransferase